jgi:hypothetical protein
VWRIFALPSPLFFPQVYQPQNPLESGEFNMVQTSVCLPALLGYHYLFSDLASRPYRGSLPNWSKLIESITTTLGGQLGKSLAQYPGLLLGGGTRGTRFERRGIFLLNNKSL